jgi:hypothetical protein
MKKSIFTLGFLAATTLAAATPTRASAEEVEPASPETKNAKPTKLVGPEGVAYVGASVSATPYILLGYFLAKDFTVAGGLGMAINGNGGATSPLTGLKGDSNANVGADLVLAMAYFVVDKFPFAAGPELVVTGSMAPGMPFDTTVLSPMVALRYTPWAAPIAIGTDIGVAIAMVHGEKPSAGLTTNGLDVIFAF